MFSFLVGFILIFTALYNSKFLNIFGIDLGFYVNGNYEFSKAMVFNLFSSALIILFLLKSVFKKSKIIIPRFIFLIFFVLIASNIFSISPYISLFGADNKGHGTLMFFNLIGIFLLLINSKIKKQIIYRSIFISAILVSIISIYELFFPTFNYGDLSNRAIGTLGHPNYLVLHLLLSFALILGSLKINKIIKYGGLTLIGVTIFLTKSIWGIFVFLTYLISVLKIQKRKKIYLLILGIILSVIIANNFGLQTKLQSFISRFYIWESVISIIFSDIKIFLFGGGLDTLSLIFEKYKSEYLYVFENIGYTADRPHNLILNIFYHTGLFGLLVFIILISKIKKGTKYFYPVIIFLSFCLLNFPSISSYLLLVIVLGLSYKKNKNSFYIDGYKKNILSIILIILFSLSALYSTKYYLAEYYYKKYNYLKASELFKYNPKYFYKLGESEKGLEISKYKSEEYLISKIISNKNKINGCRDLVGYFPTAENYFYCYELLEAYNKFEEAEKFKNIGLSKLPDLWNNNSIYFQNIFVKYFLNDTDRFFSEKYSNLKKYLE